MEPRGSSAGQQRGEQVVAARLATPCKQSVREASLGKVRRSTAGTRRSTHGNSSGNSSSSLSAESLSVVSLGFSHDRTKSSSSKP